MNIVLFSQIQIHCQSHFDFMMWFRLNPIQPKSYDKRLTKMRLTNIWYEYSCSCTHLFNDCYLLHRNNGDVSHCFNSINVFQSEFWLWFFCYCKLLITRAHNVISYLSSVNCTYHLSFLQNIRQLKQYNITKFSSGIR